jgi:hypothetical protein
MLHKCANPECSTPFRNISRGKLFHIAAGILAAPAARDLNSPRAIEHYWLCDQCTASFTLATDRDGGLTVVPLPALLRKPVQSTAEWPSNFNDGPDSLGENWERRVARAWR